MSSLPNEPTAPESSAAPVTRDRLRASMERLGAWTRTLRAKVSLAAIVLVAITAVYVWRYETFTGPRVGGDGYYSWIFARSMAFDGDFKFGNDYALCGDPWHVGVDEGGGRPANPFYVGPALVWAPMLWLARHVVTLPPHARPDVANGCTGPYVDFTLMLAPIFSGILLWMGYRIARRFAGERISLASTVLVAFCSPLTHFGSLIVSYSHVWAAFGAALATLTWIRATERPEARERWFLAGVGVGVASVMRNQSMILLLSPAISLALRIYDDARARRWPWRPVTDGLIVLWGFIAVFWIQLITYKILYGHYWVVPQGRAYLQLAYGQPVMTLFAPRSGLLYWHPLLWLGVIGCGIMVRRRETRALGVALVLPLLIDVYVNSSAYWHGGASFGSRRLTTLAAPFVGTGAIFLAALWKWLRENPVRVGVFAAAGWLLPWVIINFGASTANVDGRVPYDRPVPMPELYGNGMRYGLDGVYEDIGNPFVLPASLVFALRYGVHPRRFDTFGSGGMFEHSYRPVRVTGPDSFAFGDPNVRPWFVEGFDPARGGVLVRGGRRARMLVELGWGYVTDVQIDARAATPTPAHLRIVNGTFFRRRPVGTVTIPMQGDRPRITVPLGVFDSGVNELIFESDHDVVLQSWRWFDRSPHDSSIH